MLRGRQQKEQAQPDQRHALKDTQGTGFEALIELQVVSIRE
jgi:hypothetical protein